MRVLAIIPARYASTRFPGKPLATLGGESIISRVYNRVRSCRSVDDVIVATDDEDICVLSSSLTAFDICGRLAKAGIGAC